MPSGGGEAGRAGRRARLAVRLAAAAALCGALLAASAGPASALVSDLEGAFVARVAAERQAAGVGALTLAGDLVEVARRHSATMAAQNRLYHNPQLGTQVVNWLKVGENVGTGATVDNIHAALMASTTHRAEILRPAFSEVGVGAVTGPDGAIWVTQVFRLRESAAPPPPPPPPPTPPPTTAAPQPPPPPPAAPAPRATAALASRAQAARPATTAASTTAPTAPSPTTAATAPPTAAPAPAEDARPVALSPPPVAASATSALPLRPGLAATGSAAAGLLWLVTAALVRSLVAPRTRRA